MTGESEEEAQGKRQFNAFINLLVAAMLDASTQRKLTQLKTTIAAPGRMKPMHVRIIVVPETMDIETQKPWEHPTQGGKNG